MSGSVVGPTGGVYNGRRLAINNGPPVIRRCWGNPRGLWGGWPVAFGSYFVRKLGTIAWLLLCLNGT